MTSKYNRDDAAATSYLAFAELEEPAPSGRYAGVEPRTVTGSTPVAAPPRITGSGPWTDADGVGPEPALGYEIDAAPDLGEPPSPPQSASDPCCSTADGREPAAPVGHITSPTDAARAPTIERRRRLPA
jgi:hypothetical protein